MPKECHCCHWYNLNLDAIRLWPPFYLLNLSCLLLFVEDPSSSLECLFQRHHKNCSDKNTRLFKTSLQVKRPFFSPGLLMMCMSEETHIKGQTKVSKNSYEEIKILKRSLSRSIISTSNCRWMVSRKSWLKQHKIKVRWRSKQMVSIFFLSWWKKNWKIWLHTLKFVKVPVID